MADHFYAKTKATADVHDDNLITVGTSSAGASTIEVRIPDGVTGLTRLDVINALRHIADYVAAAPSIAILK